MSALPIVIIVVQKFYNYLCFHVSGLSIQYNKLDLVMFVMCIMVSKDFVPFCKYIKYHVYPGTKVYMKI